MSNPIKGRRSAWGAERVIELKIRREIYRIGIRKARDAHDYELANRMTAKILRLDDKIRSLEHIGMKTKKIYDQ